MAEPNIAGGYIIIARQIVESEIWNKPPLYIKVWIWLLTQAQHAEFKKLKRGQLFTNINEIREGVSWKVGWRTEKPSKDQIFNILNWLRKVDEGGNESNTSPTMITTTRATQGMLITIDNYGVYQDPKNYEYNTEANNEKVTKTTRVQRYPDNINKNDKNVKNDNKYSTTTTSPENPFTFYQQTGFGDINGFVAEDMSKWIDDFKNAGSPEPEKMVIKSLQIAVERNKVSWGYAKSILKAWDHKNIRTLESVAAEQAQFEAQRQAKQSNGWSKQPPKPRENFDREYTQEDGKW